METKHTPEPWEYGVLPGWDPGRSNYHIVRPKGEFPHGQWIADFGYPGELGELNARRAVACVNALAGLNPEGVRDAVEALRVIIERWDTPLWKDAEPTAAVIAQGRAALSNLEDVK